MLERLFKHFRSDLAVDLGQSQIRIAVAGGGIVIEEPSLVAFAPSEGRSRAACRGFGHLARQMFGRAPNELLVAEPLRGGAVADIRLCAAMLRHFLHKAQPPGFRLRPRVLAAVPGHLTGVERQALVAALHRAGAGETWLMPATLAAAVGCGLPVREPLSSMVCLVGASAAEAAVVSMGAVVACYSFRTGGDALDRSVCDFLRREKDVVVAAEAAEALRIEAGGKEPHEPCNVVGRNARTGGPAQTSVASEEILAAMREPLLTIAEGVRAAVDRLSPEMAADLAERGMVLCGGLARMPGLDRTLSGQTGIGVRLASNPPRAVAMGLLSCLENFSQWRGAMRSSEDDV